MDKDTEPPRRAGGVKEVKRLPRAIAVGQAKLCPPFGAQPGAKRLGRHGPARRILRAARNIRHIGIGIVQFHGVFSPIWP